MPFYKFDQSDIFHNRIESHPQCNFLIYSGNIYYNSRPNFVGSFTAIVPTGSQSGSVNLYELNVDRDAKSHTFDTFSDEIDGNNSKKSLIFPFIYKDGTYTDFKTISLGNVDESSVTVWNSASYGDVLTGSYPLSASIQKEYFLLNHVEKASTNIVTLTDDGTILPQTDEHGLQLKTDKGSKISALQNTLDYYAHISHHYVFSSASISDPRLNNLVTGSVIDWNKAEQEMGLLSIPSIYYGRRIKRGTVNLKYYITGTLIGELKDKNNNGELFQMGPEASEGSGNVAGVVLYNEGFILLTGSWDLTKAASAFSPAHTEKYLGTSATSPRWIDFAQTIATGSHDFMPNSSWELNFSGTSYTPTMTMLAHAKKGHLNFSNNPTYIKQGQTTTPISSSVKFREQPELEIKNIVSSSYQDFTASYKRQTYISSIGIYDERRNLIGVAKVATPVKKTEERDFTFKLKLDF